ncbi:MAG TPA: bacillithiol biosynthesis deacetylase BshB1 [Ohtaekwangia sp.]|nr:bacillithiol biosynthesis deacetylase BshB1 [Ohtaekwangia sp.]
MKLDLLVLAAHPDDAELGCAGTIAKHISLGYKVGIVDLTQGDLGTRGTIESRAEEAADAAAILGVSVRENLKFRDGFFRNDEEHQLRVIRAIRKYQPEIVLANATHDRHSDHGRASALEYDACFLSGLVKIETVDEQGRKQLPWRPRSVYHYIQSVMIQPDFIVDVSDFWDLKMQAIKAFKSQFFDPSSAEPETYISKPGFLRMIESRAVEFGHAINVQYGEGYTHRQTPGIKDLFHLL